MKRRIIKAAQNYKYSKLPEAQQEASGMARCLRKLSTYVDIAATPNSVLHDVFDWEGLMKLLNQASIEVAAFQDDGKSITSNTYIKGGLDDGLLALVIDRNPSTDAKELDDGIYSICCVIPHAELRKLPDSVSQALVDYDLVRGDFEGGGVVDIEKHMRDVPDHVYEELKAAGISRSSDKFDIYKLFEIE